MSTTPLAHKHPTIRLLLVEDNPTDVLVACDELDHAVGVVFEVVQASRLQEALTCLKTQSFDVVVLDLSLPDSEGLDTFQCLHAAAPIVPVVVVSQRIDERLALQAVQAGAQDYLVKEQTTGLLVRTVRYALERVQSQQAQRGTEERLAGVIESAMDAIISTDSLQRIVVFNKAAETMFGYPAVEMMGQCLSRLMPGAFRSRHQAHMDTFASTGVIARGMGDQVQLSGLRANGDVFPIETSISKVRVGGQMLFTAIVRDLTASTIAHVALQAANRDLARTNAALEHIAHYDALTGLPNRVLLADRLLEAMTQCQRQGRSLAVAFIDLDAFKPINDTHGHEVGDDLLVDVAKRIKAVLRPWDCLARMGGDEFVAVLGDLEGGRDSEPVLADILKAISAPILVQGVVMHVSASIGVTIFPQDGDDADRLIRHADQAMYLAKETGRNRHYLFDTALAVAAHVQRDDLQDIQRGLAQNEFVLHYQPKVNMRSGAVIGAEALIRWQHPVRGLLQPVAFLPVIEGHAVSIALGEWVIAAALAQMSAWVATGLRMAVSVNIAGLQLQQEGFVAQLVETFAAYPTVAPHQLEMEILETSALQDIGQISCVMQACQALGVRFALDDFGTGYSSLTYLKRLPAEQIKIDQSFIRNMLGDTEDLTIVKGVIGLASAFGREVIAEGVETVAHGRALLDLGCNLAQGYGIARPMPAQELPGWVAKWRAHPMWSDGAAAIDPTEQPESVNA